MELNDRVILTTERARTIRNDHDGSNGFAGRVCPVCGTMHPCQTFVLASDLVEVLEQLATR